MATFNHQVHKSAVFAKSTVLLLIIQDNRNDESSLMTIDFWPSEKRQKLGWDHHLLWCFAKTSTF